MTSVSSHRYTVELRVSGKDLVASKISEEMGLQPTHVREAGERRGTSSVFNEGVWSFAGVGAQEWDSLETGLASLMKELLPKKALIASYVDKFDVCWWCAHFQGSFDGGPTFSPELLRDLASFGVALFLDNFFSE